jgi:catechol 2,3-dioxygenase-like lactoylglutathione lyase family enzyme
MAEEVGPGRTRRETLQLAGAGASSWLAASWLGEGVARAANLPLASTGLEHIGMTVPDQDAASKFYGLLFDPQLFQERDPPPRYYVRTGIHYIAFGGPANNAATGARPIAARIDHFCALVEDYKPQEIQMALEDSGVKFTAGTRAMAMDPDGLRLQMLPVPGGLSRTIIPSRRISQDEPAVQAIGFEHIMLAVTDMEKSASHYRKLFGMETQRSKKPERIWFTVAKTRLGLEPVASGATPRVAYVSIRVAGFDRRAVSERLKKLGAEVIPSEDKDAVRFKDPNGLMMELKA